MKHVILSFFIFTILAPNGEMLTVTEVGGNAMVISNQSTGKEIVVARQRNGVILMPSDGALLDKQLRKSEGRGDFLDLERNTLTPLDAPDPFTAE